MPRTARCVSISRVTGVATRSIRQGMNAHRALTGWIAVALLGMSSLAWARDAATGAADLPSVMNFRDLGGKRTRDGACVRTGLLFRSATFANTTAADATALVRRTGLHVYYDLRSPREIERFGGPAELMAAGVRWQRMPIDMPSDDPIFQAPVRDAAAWSAFYLRMVEQRGDQIGRLLHEWAHGDVPAVFGCSLGKDRTGVATALLLAALGVDDAAIADDYMNTTRQLVAHASAFADWWQTYHISREQFIRTDMTAHAETMTLFMKGVRARYGSIEGALKHMGVGEDALKALRKRYLTEMQCS